MSRAPGQLRALSALCALAFGCHTPEAVPKSSTPARPEAAAPEHAAPGPAKSAPAPRVTEEQALRARDDLPAAQRALVIVDGKERWVDARAIESVGYTLIDLSDDWTPYIFAEHATPEGVPLHNRYRRVFTGLANDRLDGDGEALPEGEENYLELYGVFPSLSVLRKRFVRDAAQPCHDQESTSVLEAIETVTYVAPKDVKKNEARLRALSWDLEAAQKKAKAATLEELAQVRPQLAPRIALAQKKLAEKAALSAVERRLSCEKLLTAESKHKTGIYDEPMRLAVRKFQQKHMIYEANYLRKKTVDALARPLVDNDYDALVRALRERVVDAAGIIEDGSGGTKKYPARNLADEYTQVALAQLGLRDAASAQAFFERHPAQELKSLRAAVKLPARPAYYSPSMDLSIVVDRGDVWYDLPFDAEGNFRNHPRSRYPSLTLFTMHGDEKIPLARWRTTIGGWRAEQAQNGYEYFRYKNSEVGARVIKQIISGPVWVAPPSTPIRGLVKGKTVNGKPMAIVNYDELGPGYLSAYGLVAGYFVVQGKNGKPDWDHGVRAHGSSDYLSIYSSNGFSHGCHRLPNHIAIRLYSFILRHRNKLVAGDQPLNYTRQFLKDDIVYEIKIPSRGYAYVLDPPLPVMVREGTIKGAQKEPIKGYVPKPNIQYPPGPVPAAPDSVESMAGG